MADVNPFQPPESSQSGDASLIAIGSLVQTLEKPRRGFRLIFFGGGVLLLGFVGYFLFPFVLAPVFFRGAFLFGIVSFLASAIGHVMLVIGLGLVATLPGEVGGKRAAMIAFILSMTPIFVFFLGFLAVVTVRLGLFSSVLSLITVGAIPVAAVSHLLCVLSLMTFLGRVDLARSARISLILVLVTSAMSVLFSFGVAFAAMVNRNQPMSQYLSIGGVVLGILIAIATLVSGVRIVFLARRCGDAIRYFVPDESANESSSIFVSS